MKLGASHPMGPLQLCDFIGLDVLQAVCESLFDEFKRDEYAPPPLMKRMIAAGRLGRKSDAASTSTPSNGMSSPPTSGAGNQRAAAGIAKVRAR